MYVFLAVIYISPPHSTYGYRPFPPPSLPLKPTVSVDLPRTRVWRRRSGDGRRKDGRGDSTRFRRARDNHTSGRPVRCVRSAQRSLRRGHPQVQAQVRMGTGGREPGEGGGGVYSICAWPQSYDYGPSHPSMLGRSTSGFHQPGRRGGGAVLGQKLLYVPPGLAPGRVTGRPRMR